jgi:hypothetical protein
MDEGKRNRPSYYFKSVVPWVYCGVLNYSQIAAATQSVGWIAQHEVFFLVPLAWYEIKNGELVFKDWAMVCPFIFVDNDFSLMTGREHYGWVKVRAWLDRLDPDWADEPRNPRVLMDMRTKLFPRVYAGEPLEPRSLLQITQEPAPNVLANPFSAEGLLSPLWGMSDALRTSIRFLEDTLGFVGGLPFKGYDARSVPSAAKMLTQSWLNLGRLLPWWQLDRDTMSEAYARAHARGPNFYLNQITLKQFRDAAEPKYACYQALVHSRVTIDHIYRQGLLGASSVALGDPTGGIRLLLHDYPEQQIQSTLGLEVTEWRRGEDKERLAVLTPCLPFWATYDLRYDNGDTLCWRTKTSDWHCDPCVDRVPKSGRANRFNATRGAAIQALHGPFVYPDVTARVFPLKADREHLLDYCEEYLNRHGDEPTVGELRTINGDRFEPWGDFVYMVVVTHGTEDSVAYSEGNNVGPIAGDQIVFYVPVKWYRKWPNDSEAFTEVNKEEKLFKLGVLTPYVFGDGRQVVSEREVNGIPSLYGQVLGGPDAWLNTYRGQERSVLAHLQTLVVTPLDAGQPAREETLIEIVEVPDRVLDVLESELKSTGNVVAATVKWLNYWVFRLHYWIERLYGLILGVFGIVLRPRFLTYLAKLPFNYVALKEVKSTSKEAGKPVEREMSYQAIVLVEKTMERLFDGDAWVEKNDWKYQRFAESLNDNIRIDIRYHDMIDIAGKLGLGDPNIVSRPGSAPIQEFRPENPFMIRVHLEESLGCNVSTKVAGAPWSRDIAVHKETETRCSFEPLRWLERQWLKSFADEDGPQQMIKDYLRVFAKGTGLPGI